LPGGQGVGGLCALAFDPAQSFDQAARLGRLGRGVDFEDGHLAPRVGMLAMLAMFEEAQ